MSSVVYDVLLRTEVRARDEEAALTQVASYIREFGVNTAALQPGLEVIRNDALNPGARDDQSRQHNGFVVLDSNEKHGLLRGLQAALEAAGAGDAATGQALLAELEARFRYSYRRDR